MNSRCSSRLGLVTVVVATWGASLGSTACKPKPTAEEAMAAARKVAFSSVATSAGLSQSFRSPGKLITLHFPRDFAAEAPNENVAVLSRELGDGSSEVLSFITVAAPASQELDEFTRTAALAEVKRPVEWEYHEVSHAKATCNGSPGLNIVATWKPDGSPTLHRRWWCAFLRDGHGYAFSYNVPAAAAAKDEPLLRAIVEATTFDRP